MKKISSFLLAAGLCLCLTGCSSPLDDLDQNSIYVQKESRVITEILIDQMGADDDFTLEELQEYVDDDLNYWREKLGEEAVLLDELTISEEGAIKIQMEYSDYSAYAETHNQTFFYGTIREALEAGYTFPEELYDKNGDIFQTQVFSSNPDDYCIVVMSEPVQILTDTWIIGATSNVVLKDKKKAAALPAEGDTEGYSIPDSTAVILFKAK